jgi:predicted ABC-type ATPase
MPKVIIIAGPNGAGKTTFAKSYLPVEAGVIQFVNADMIAAGISPFDPTSANVAAGRVMLERLRDLVEDQRDFALETTLSGRWLAKQILDWKCVGYEVELYYLRLSTVEVSLERIEQRVKNGGHNIPEEVARRRFDRSLGLLEELYKNLVDVWSVWNNEGDIPILLEASTWLA